MELNIGMKYHNVKWKVSETLQIIKYYNIKKYGDLKLNHDIDSIMRKSHTMGLPSIKRKTYTSQVKINNKIHNYVYQICKTYNKKRRLDLDFIDKISPKNLTIVKNSFPKMYFDRMLKETKTLIFIENNKRCPSQKATKKSERSLGGFLNMEQFYKKSLLFLGELEKAKVKNGIKSMVGKKVVKSDETMVELISFVKKNKYIPKGNFGKTIKERRLGRFYSATCTKNGNNYRSDLTIPHMNFLLQYMEYGGFKKTRQFYKETIYERNN